MEAGITHIIGAGLAGLSAATRLAEQGRHVAMYEASAQAGGRCRSYYEPTLDAVIDNGNHLLLSGNDYAHQYLTRIGADDLFTKVGEPIFDFHDVKSGKKWPLKLGKGRLPLWLLDKDARVPDTTIGDYFSILKLLRAKPQQTVLQLLNENSILYKNLWHPLLLSALNTHLSQASASLAGAIIRGTLLKGGAACIPLVADGLSTTFIDPALRYLGERKAEISFNRRVRDITFENNKATKLEFTSGEAVVIAENDAVICAVPPWAVTHLLPGISAPQESRAILNVHFNAQAPATFPRLVGIINATTEWVFAFPGRISVTVSDADALMQEDREALAARIWREVSAITGLANPLPAWQIVKEKRATFAATPQEDAKRPQTQTGWENIYLAGDWVQTGLPATIEGAIFSGLKAAELRMGKG